MPDGVFKQIVGMVEPYTQNQYTVPNGKRLVIENVSINAFLPTGQTVFASVSNGVSQTFIPLIAQGLVGSIAVHRNSMLVRDYVEPGGLYQATIQRSPATDNLTWEVTAVGHLVDCANGGGC
jgi:hypothetical protein